MKPKPAETLSLGRSLRVYWPNVLAIALTPTLTAVMMVLVPPLWPVVFLSLTMIGILVPYRFRNAPYSYVFVCLLVYLTGGLLVPLVYYALWAIGIPAFKIGTT